jgi:hypothetical protein
VTHHDGRRAHYQTQAAIADLTASFARLREQALMFKTFDVMRLDRLGCQPALKVVDAVPGRITPPAPVNGDR